MSNNPIKPHQIDKFFKDRFGLLYLFLIIHILFALILRATLIGYSRMQINHNLRTFLNIFLIGGFYDFISGIYLAIPLILYLTITPQKIFQNRLNKLFVFLSFFIGIYILNFSALAEYTFWNEFGVRFNFIAVDYLIYTHEVIGNIRESYPLPLLLSVLFIISLLTLWLIHKKITISLNSKDAWKSYLPKGIILLIIPIIAFFIIGGPYTSFSSNTFEKELSLNGIYQLFSAFINNTIDFDQLYPRIDEKIALQELSRLKHQDDPVFTPKKITYHEDEKRYNFVLIMEESLSAKFLGDFGNKSHLTPNLDKIAKECLFFTRLYATGTRTTRGMEAVTLSIPPTPGRSIVKRPDNDNMFSLGFLFKQRGYDTKFIYSGYGYFDNMNAFFSKNGFDVIDRNNLKNEEISFANIWGVCDEDILIRVIKECDKSYQNQKPFFSYLMTTSNHRPFTYPEGKIDIPSHTNRDGGVKYADYALGEFFKEAQKRPWFDNTIFVIIADHCAGSAGRSSLPVHRYHIPLFIYAPRLQGTITRRWFSYSLKVAGRRPTQSPSNSNADFFSPLRQNLLV